MTQRPTRAEIADVSGPAWQKLADGFAARRLGVVRKLLAAGDNMASIADQLKISQQALTKFFNNRSNKNDG